MIRVCSFFSSTDFIRRFVFWIIVLDQTYRRRIIIGNSEKQWRKLRRNNGNVDADDRKVKRNVAKWIMLIILIINIPRRSNCFIQEIISKEAWRVFKRNLTMLIIVYAGQLNYLIARWMTGRTVEFWNETRPRARLSSLRARLVRVCNINVFSLEFLGNAWIIVFKKTRRRFVSWRVFLESKIFLALTSISVLSLTVF